MRWRLDVLRPVTVDDGFATVDGGWAEVMSMAAERLDLKAAERTPAAPADATAVFRVRWTRQAATITTADRLRCEGRTYAIVTVRAPDFRKTLELHAGEIVE